MTTSASKRICEMMKSYGKCGVKSVSFESPIGKLRIVCCSQGLHLLKQIDGDHLCTHVDSKLDERRERHLEDCAQWLTMYWSDPRGVDALPTPTLCTVDLNANYVRIWYQLAETRIGDTLSYAELSQRVFGHKKCSRVVGTAMRLNPFSIVVPCHRVIKSNGDFGHYSGGTKDEVKKYLILREKSAVE